MIDNMIKCIKLVNKRKTCGMDRVHPVWLTLFDIDDTKDRDQLEIILRKAIRKDNLFSTRLCLIPNAVQGQYQPIQVNNVPLRLLEKNLLSQVKNIPLKNPESLHGFVEGRSTHTAYSAVQQRLKDTSDPCCFLDMSKAYNSLKHEKLIEIIDLNVHDMMTNDLLNRLYSSRTVRLLENSSNQIAEFLKALKLAHGSLTWRWTASSWRSNKR